MSRSRKIHPQTPADIDEQSDSADAEVEGLDSFSEVISDQEVWTGASASVAFLLMWLRCAQRVMQSIRR